MLHVTTPATIFDLARLSNSVSHLHWIVAKELWRKGESWVVWHGEDPLGLICLTPFFFDGEVTEATFCMTEHTSKHMLGIVRRIRLTLSEGTYSDLVTVVRTRAGARLARLCDFDAVTETEIGEVWAYVGTTRGRRRRSGGPTQIKRKTDSNVSTA
jgi:hypothetical protein